MEVVKKVVLDLVVIVDICLCEYINYGYCGYLEMGDLIGWVLNDFILELLKKIVVF